MVLPTSPEDENADRTSAPGCVAGLVLTGGRSSRMGADKSLLRVRGRPLAVAVAAALAGAGCSPVVAVGGDGPSLRALGLPTLPDVVAGDGPLSAVVHAWATLAPELPVVVAACDLPDLTAATVEALLAALLSEPGGEVAVPVTAGVPQVHLFAAMPPARPVLAAAVADGERSLRRALRQLRVVEVEECDGAVVDVDCPQDLARYAPGVSVPEIALDSFAEHVERGAHVLDVRNPDEYAAAHVPGVQLIPLAELVDRVAEVPTDRTVYVICAVGGRSAKAAEFLRMQGIDAVNVAGGTKAWIASGRTVETGTA